MSDAVTSLLRRLMLAILAAAIMFVISLFGAFLVAAGWAEDPA